MENITTQFVIGTMPSALVATAPATGLLGAQSGPIAGVQGISVGTLRGATTRGRVAGCPQVATAFGAPCVATIVRAGVGSDHGCAVADAPSRKPSPGRRALMI